MRSNFPEDLDYRPYPLWLQGFVSGLAIALVISAFIAHHIDAGDGTLHYSTTYLILAALIAGAFAPFMYLPITRKEALERFEKRTAHLTPAPQGTQLRLVPGYNTYNRTTEIQRRPSA